MAQTAVDAVEENVFLGVLADAIGALERDEVPYVLVGGIAATAYGRDRWTADLDVLVHAGDADRALEALGRAGFGTERTNPQWIFKATRDGVTVDVIFWLKGNVVLDEELLAHARETDVRGVRARVAAPEDVVVLKAMAHDEQSPRHWGDALGVLAACELDWVYLVRRARFGARRVLSLLVYAESNDLVVPSDVIRRLFELVYPQEGS